MAEDTDVTIEEIRQEFGVEIARLVDGVTSFKQDTVPLTDGRASVEPAQDVPGHGRRLAGCGNQAC